MQGIWFVAFVLQWVLLIVITVLLAGVLRYLAAFQERMKLAAPPISRFELGERVSDFELPDLRGGIFPSRSLRGQAAVFLSISPGCGSCRSVVAQIAELATRPGTMEALGQRIVLIVSGKREAFNDMLRENPDLNSDALIVLNDEKGIISHQYGIISVPSGIAIDQGGRVRSQSMNPHVNWLYKVLEVTAPVGTVEPVGKRTFVGPAIHVPD